MVEGIISDIQRFSIHDGPGIRTTVFLKGCPLGCLWCGNPETVSPQPEIMFSEQSCMKCGICRQACCRGVIKIVPGQFPLRNRELCAGCGACAEVCPKNALVLRGTRMSVAQVFSEIAKDVPFYRRSGGGLTLSGGEPFLQANFIKALLEVCKQQEIHTAVDTSGYTEWRNMEQAVEDIDIFLYDLKHVDPVAHERGTTVSNALILENLQKLLQLGKRVVLRLPLIPDFNSSEEDLSRIAAFACQLGVEEIRILPYHTYGRGKYKKIGKNYPLEKLRVMDSADVERAKKLIPQWSQKILSYHSKQATDRASKDCRNKFAITHRKSYQM